MINELLELEANPNAITPSSGKEYPLDEAALRSRTGIYSSGDSKQRIELTSENGRLVMRIVGSHTVMWPLKAESDNYFYNTMKDYELEFQGSAMILYDYTTETRMAWRKEDLTR